jgi:aspartate/tyrosine/aromatic aminotransferase
VVESQALSGEGTARAAAGRIAIARRSARPLGGPTFRNHLKDSSRAGWAIREAPFLSQNSDFLGLLWQVAQEAA